MMPGVSMREIRDAIVDSYTADKLDEAVRFLLNERLENIAPPGDTPHRVFKLLEWADMHGRDAELVQALGKDRPRSPRMQQVVKKYGMAVPVAVQTAGAAAAGSPTDAADGGLERIVRPLLAVPDFGLWRERMTRVEGQVCRITLNGNAQGTGFLVGPDAVLTNYHVMKPVLDGAVPPAAVECQFDFKLLRDGTAPYTPVKLAADWDLDHSPYSAAEKAGTPDAAPPAADELDYALVRLAEPVGDRPWAKSPDAGGNAPLRGWVRVPDAAPAFPPTMAVIIAQHPQGQPMKLALDTAAVDRSKGGSSGSPCFDFGWGLVALHHYGDPAYGHPPAFNQGVPIGAIRGRLTARNKAAALGGDVS